MLTHLSLQLCFAGDYCIRGKVCNTWLAGTSVDVRFVIYSKSKERFCVTNSLDNPNKDDWSKGRTVEFCGEQFLGECYRKQFPKGFVVRLLKTSFIQIFDSLCMDWIEIDYDEMEIVSGTKGKLKLDDNKSTPGRSCNSFKLYWIFLLFR